MNPRCTPTQAVHFARNVHTSKNGHLDLERATAWNSVRLFLKQPRTNMRLNTLNTHLHTISFFFVGDKSV